MIMKRLTLNILLAVLGIGSIQAQDIQKDFGWMAGDWDGGGWVMDSKTREANKFDQHEHIVWGAGETVLMIQGTGTDPESGDQSFSAAGILYWDAKAEGYKMHAFTEKDGGVIADIEFRAPGDFSWGFDVPGGSVEYDVVAKSGVWTESGFFRPQGSDQRYPFMEMKVKKLAE